MFRIGEFAGLGGVSAKMLRAWDALGLFRPVWVDPVSGYRGYSPAQLPELRRIIALRDVGVPLADIARFVAGGADLRAVLAGRRAELERERSEVDRRLQALEITVAMADEAAAADRAATDGPATDGPAIDRPATTDRRAVMPDVVIRPVAAEGVATCALEEAASDMGPAFYELEAYVRDCGYRASRPPGAIADAAGDRFVEVFVPVRRAFEQSGRIGYRRLPACRAASIIHRGSYSGLSPARAALEGWIRSAGLGPAGPLRILYLQFGAEPELRVPRAYLVDRSADFVTELQQPIA